MESKADETAVLVGIGSAGLSGTGPGGDPVERLDALAPLFPARKMRYRGGPPPDLERFVPKGADRRAMNHQFHLGVCAAGEALGTVDLTDDERRNTAIFVAGRVGERSESLDAALFELDGQSDDVERQINLALMTSLRPTTFLSQIPNMLAGNIALILGVTGDSRTFMGEENAGANALHAALRGIECHRYKTVLVGGALNAKRENLLRWFAAGGRGADAADDASPRSDAKCLASGGVFLVLAGEREAQARGWPILARLRTLVRSRLNGAAESGTSYARALDAAWDRLGSQAATPSLIVSNADSPQRRQAEIRFWANKGIPATSQLYSVDQVGNLLEADAALQVALAMDGMGRAGAPNRAVVVTGGHTRDLTVFMMEGPQ